MNASTAETKKKVLLGVTGSVASTRFAALVEALRDAGYDVKVILTNAATQFVRDEDIARTGIDRGHVYGDDDEWAQWRQIGDPVLHIDLAKWADVFLLAPLSANTLAKFANGLCDNLLTCVFRAWDFDKPVVLAPAMNTQMWNNPFTSRHRAALDDVARGAALWIEPIEKRLACGDVGVGAMAEVDHIIHVLAARVTSRDDGPSVV